MFTAIIASVTAVAVAVIGIYGRRKLQTIEINTNHRLDQALEEIRSLRGERDDRAADDLRKAKGD